MAINIAHRRDPDARVEEVGSAARSAGAGGQDRGRRAGVGRELDEQAERARPNRAGVEAALERLAEAGDRFREREGRGRFAAAGRALSQVWQDEFYDEHGLPE